MSVAAEIESAMSVDVGYHCVRNGRYRPGRGDCCAGTFHGPRASGPFRESHATAGIHGLICSHDHQSACPGRMDDGRGRLRNACGPRVCEMKCARHGLLGGRCANAVHLFHRANSLHLGPHGHRANVLRHDRHVHYANALHLDPRDHLESVFHHDHHDHFHDPHVSVVHHGPHGHLGDRPVNL